MSEHKQLGLFAVDELPIPSTNIDVHISDADRELAAKLPSFVRFGTSSWSFPGWAGVLWKGTPTESALAKTGLEAYARHPLFRTVGLDRSYYGPLRADEVRSYERQLAKAPGFRMIAKVWDEITTAVFPKHPRYGARAGSVNPKFLDPAVLATDVLAAYSSSAPADFVFELTPMPQGAMDQATLISRVDAFIARLPSQHRYAFELRNADLFGPRWTDMLRANGVAHVYTYWTAMPSLAEQLRVSRGPTAKHTVVRLMLPPYTRYAERKADFAPFNKIVEAQPDMRTDVADILRAAEASDADDAFVVVNNKAEGSAPLTIRALAAQIISR